MADKVSTPNPGENKIERYVHPAFNGVIQLVDIIDLGIKAWIKPGVAKAKLQHRITWVWRTGHQNPDGGFPVDIAQEFANSTFKNGSNASPLRRVIESWTGKSVPDEELPSFDMSVFVGRYGYGAIVNSPGKKDASKIFAELQTVIPVPQGMPLPSFEPYERAEFWADKKNKIAEEAAPYIKAAEQERRSSALPQPAQDDDSDLPF